jgi:hypothetical protein
MLRGRLGVRFLVLIIRIRLEQTNREAWSMLRCLRILFFSIVLETTPRLNASIFLYYQNAESLLCILA